MMNYNINLEDFCHKLKLDLFGIADLRQYKTSKEIITIPRDLLEKFDFGIVIAIKLDDDLMNQIINHPIPEYNKAYLLINKKLDKLSNKIKKWILKQGFNALTINASKIIDNNKQLGNLSHKTIGRLAGLGWQGKSLLLINPLIGPRFRMATILTNLPLNPNKPIENKCGNCKLCVDACPASAIKNTTTDSHYNSRDEAVDIGKCISQINEWKKLPGIPNGVCGICVSVCPYGKKNQLKK